MNRIEIKQRKKLVIPLLVFVLLTLLITGYVTFFTAEYKDNATSQISFLIGVVILAYVIYSPVGKLLRDQPIIILEKDSITLNAKKIITILKNEIEYVDVTRGDDTGYSLDVKTRDTTHSISILWLDKTPDEIKELIKSYGNDNSVSKS